MNSLALEETKTLPGNEYLPLFYMTLVLYVDNIYIAECFHMQICDFDHKMVAYQKACSKKYKQWTNFQSKPSKEKLAFQLGQVNEYTIKLGTDKQLYKLLHAQWQLSQQGGGRFHGPIRMIHMYHESDKKHSIRKIGLKEIQHSRRKSPI